VDSSVASSSGAAATPDAAGTLEAALPKTYDPAGTEARWQAAWEQAGAFHPDANAPGEPFSVVIPPPNVTGSLHMGHAFNTALIDTIVRFQRLQGKNVLCLPGTDHASIAVQTILEKQIKAEGASKDDLGRDAFFERAWAWKAQSGGTIVGQLRRLGYSVDWKRERFTLDPGLNKAVVEAFLRLHEQGLIYRGEYLVNWCPASGSAVSDLEVEMKEVEGSLWHLRYPLTPLAEEASAAGAAPASDHPLDHLVVATTRPETMLGDVAVMVHPEDARYAAFVGKRVTLPLCGRTIPVIADEDCIEYDDIAELVGLVDGVNLKQVKIGGLGPSLRGFRQAEALGLRRMFGSMVETKLGTAGAAAVAGAAEFLDLDGPIGLVGDPFTGLDLDEECRWILNDEKPGSGVTFAPAANG
jgi:isoleucyl-tRNA synthetase